MSLRAALPILAAALSACRTALPAGDANRPDVVLISIDSLRADHLSSYGYARDTSPRIDAIAAQGLRFTNARSASPWTLPSHLTMMTGKWPTEHQVIEDDLALAPDVPVIAETLRAQGYATAGFVSTIYVSAGYGFSRGFETWNDFGITERDNLTHPVHVSQLVDQALGWIRKQSPGQPAFVFVHVYDVHYPYRPPAPFDGRYDPPGTMKDTAYKTYAFFQKHPLSAERMAHQVAQYDESIRYVDDTLGALYDAWSARPAFWLITADHGEEFGERGSWGHGHTLYREALDIPLVLAGPGIRAAVRDERVGTIDVAPTLAAIAGGMWPGDGVDLRGPVPERTFYAETSRFDTNRLSIQAGVHRLDLDYVNNARQLFDLGADRAETHDVSDVSPEVAASMEAELYAALGEPWSLDPGGSVQTGGAIWQAGVDHRGVLVSPGSFGIWPPDSRLSTGIGDLRGTLEAPTRGPVRYEGPHPAVAHTTTNQTAAQLEALGYVQGGP